MRLVGHPIRVIRVADRGNGPGANHRGARFSCHRAFSWAKVAFSQGNRVKEVRDKRLKC
jgi:hypothetical protein